MGANCKGAVFSVQRHTHIILTSLVFDVIFTSSPFVLFLWCFCFFWLVVFFFFCIRSSPPSFFGHHRLLHEPGVFRSLHHCTTVLLVHRLFAETQKETSESCHED